MHTLTHTTWKGSEIIVAIQHELAGKNYIKDRTAKHPITKPAT